LIPPSATEIKEMLQDFNDMTSKLKEATAGLTSAREEAMHAANVKSEFLANMSHEIRTPLNVIIGLSDLIYERELDRDTKSEMDVLRKSGTMLLNIVNDILDYSKFEAGHVSASNDAFNLHQMITNVAKMVEPLANQRNLKVAAQIAGDVPHRICGDRQLFEQALLNLSNNAVKFTSSGCITIQARTIRENHAPKLELSVIDTGIGIPPEKVDKLFLRFEQGDSSITRTYGGTGLGLAIVKQITTLLAGEIRVLSSVGHGSTFILTFPIKVAESQIDEVKSDVVIQANFTGFDRPPKILIADDSEDNRFVIQHFLQPTGAELYEVANGREAIDAFTAHKFDLVLMDVQMPEVDGYQATREIRRLERETNRRAHQSLH